MMAALTFPLICGFAALAIDLGSIFLQTRQLQGDADLAAMEAADHLENPQAAADATAHANGWRYPVTADVVTGVYAPNGAIPASERFVPNGASPNAVRVTLTTRADLFFGASILGVSTIPIRRTATASAAQEASFSIGTGLASLQGGIANALLGGLTGSQISLSVMDYNALASANVDLLQYSQALQTDLQLTGASYNTVLSANTSQHQALQVLGDVLTSEGQNQAGAAMQTIANAASASAPAQLGQLIDLGPYGGQDHVGGGSGVGVGVNALQLATALLEVAQGGRQVQFDLGATVPALSTVTAWLAIGQRPANSPWITVTDSNSVIVRTAQARLYIDAQLVPAVGLLGVSTVDAPIYVEIASAEAKLSGLTCKSRGAPEAASLSVAPSVGEIALGQVDTSQLNNFDTELPIAPATLVRTPVLTATGQAEADLGGADWQTVSFSASDIQAHATKTVSTDNVAQATVGSLLGTLNVQVQSAGLNLGLGGDAVAPAIETTLESAADSLDALLDSLTGLLGVRLGYADVQIDGVRCNDAALVA